MLEVGFSLAAARSFHFTFAFIQTVFAILLCTHSVGNGVVWTLLFLICSYLQLVLSPILFLLLLANIDLQDIRTLFVFLCNDISFPQSLYIMLLLQLR